MRIKNVVAGSSWLWRDVGRVGLHALCEHLLDQGCNMEWFTIPFSLLLFASPRHMSLKLHRLARSLGPPWREQVGKGHLVNRVPLTPLHPVSGIPFLESYFVSSSYLGWRVSPLSALAQRDGVFPVDMLLFDTGGTGIYYEFAKEASVVVYRVNDLLAEFPRQTKGSIACEREIIRKADLVLPVSGPIYDEVLRIRGSAEGVHLLPNGVNLRLFSAAAPCPPEYAAIPEPRAALVGALSSWYDWDLLAEVARMRPGVSFCLIGRGDVPDMGLKNVHVLGPRAPEQVPAYMQHASVGLIPFKDLPRIRKTERPLKFYQYIASGLPVVSVPYGALSTMAPHALFGATPAEFAEAIDAALAYTDEDRAHLREAAVQYSWDAIMERFDAILSQQGFEVG